MLSERERYRKKFSPLDYVLTITMIISGMGWMISTGFVEELGVELFGVVFYGLITVFVITVGLMLWRSIKN